MGAPLQFLVQAFEHVGRLHVLVVLLRQPVAPPTRRTLPRPKPGAAAVAALIDLQDEYRTWRDNLPASLEGSKLAEKLHAITELDLEELQAIEPPRGYGRD